MTKVAARAERRGTQRAGMRNRPRVRARPPRRPEPHELLDAPGRPLDPGLRRELERRLGHDFTRVRIHTDPDAAALAGLAGADAVTVGQDVFFGEGMFQPWSADGRRLIAHELLHTVQAPHPPGALRAGRDPGALSVPGEPLERQAEGEARRPGQADVAAPADRPGARERPVTAASWLRYATVTPEQRRTEQLDPATLVDRLVAGVLRSLRGDPVDSSRRVRLQLVRFGPELRSVVLDKLEIRLPSPDFQQIRKIAADIERDAAPLQADSDIAPEPVSSSDEDIAGEREAERETQHADRRQRQQQGSDADLAHRQEQERAERQHHEDDQRIREQDRRQAADRTSEDDRKRRQDDDAQAAVGEKKKDEDKTAADRQKQQQDAGAQGEQAKGEDEKQDETAHAERREATAA